MSTRIQKPEIQINEIFSTCIRNIGDDRKIRISAYLNHLIYKQNEYNELTNNDTLDSFKKVDSTVSDSMFKEDMIWLYKKKFSELKSPGRDYYDKLKLSAKEGTCPYCLHRKVSQLDHYLPKTYFPSLSITPENLVPSCSDCNGDKNADVDKLFAHPYFDDIDQTIFLKCSLSVFEDGLVVKYELEQKDNLSNKLFEKIENQISSSNLLDFYAKHAITEFNMQKRTINRIKGKAEDLNSHLKDYRISAEEEIGLNSWQAALGRELESNRVYLDYLSCL